MGCGNSRESTIRELKEIMLKLKEENLELEIQKDNFRLQQDLKGKGELKDKNSLSQISNLAGNLEINLKDVKNTGVKFLPPNIPNAILEANIIRTISIQNDLEVKNEEVYELKNVIFAISLQKEQIQEQIIEFEKKTKQLEYSFITRRPEQMEINYYIQKIMQLEDTKQRIIGEITDLDGKIKAVTNEISGNEPSLKEQENDILSYEFLLTMSDEDIKDSMVKVEREIKDLTDHLKKLKDMEYELEELNKYVNNIKGLGVNRVKELRKLIDDSRNRIKALNREKEKLKNEIEYLNKLDDKGNNKVKTDYENFEMKILGKEESPLRAQRLLLNNNIDEALKKGKNAGSVRNK